MFARLSYTCVQCAMRCRLSNDFLLPTMITFLNDRDWQTRAAFFREVPCMAAQAGFAGMEAFLLPCVEQARTHCQPLRSLLPSMQFDMGVLIIVLCRLHTVQRIPHSRCIQIAPERRRCRTTQWQW